MFQMHSKNDFIFHVKKGQLMTLFLMKCYTIKILLQPKQEDVPNNCEIHHWRIAANTEKGVANVPEALPRALLKSLC